MAYLFNPAYRNQINQYANTYDPENMPGSGLVYFRDPNNFYGGAVETRMGSPEYQRMLAQGWNIYSINSPDAGPVTGPTNLGVHTPPADTRSRWAPGAREAMLANQPPAGANADGSMPDMLPANLPGIPGAGPAGPQYSAPPPFMGAPPPANSPIGLSSVVSGPKFPGNSVPPTGQTFGQVTPGPLPGIRDNPALNATLSGVMRRPR